jgi:prolipoprotein diacylglyceryltransferase
MMPSMQLKYRIKDAYAAIATDQVCYLVKFHKTSTQLYEAFVTFVFAILFFLLENRKRKYTGFIFGMF